MDYEITLKVRVKDAKGYEDAYFRMVGMIRGTPLESANIQSIVSADALGETDEDLPEDNGDYHK